MTNNYPELDYPELDYLDLTEETAIPTMYAPPVRPSISEGFVQEIDYILQLAATEEPDYATL